MNNFHILTDVIIAGSIYFALGTIICLIFSWCSVQNVRSWTIPVFLLALCFVVGMIFSMTVVPTTVHTKTQAIDLKTYSGRPIKAALIADLHVGEFANTSSLNAAIDVLKEIDDIDIFLIAGDFMFESEDKYPDLDALANISDHIPTYAVLGNHDYQPNRSHAFESEVRPGLVDYLQGLNITVLQDDCVKIEMTEDRSIFVIGTQDIYYRNPDFSCIEEIPKNEPFLMLTHNPDTAEMAIQENIRKPDLILSGHTHGGELRLPNDIYLLPLPTALIPDSFDKGFFTYKDIPLFITSGLGTVATRIRTFNNPEIVILELM